MQLRACVNDMKTVQSAVVSLLIHAWLAVLSSGVTVVGQQAQNFSHNEQDSSKAGMGCT